MPVRFDGGYPDPRCIRAVVDVELAISVHGGITLLDPWFRRDVDEGSAACAAAGPDGDVDWSARILDGVFHNVGGSLVGMDVTGEDHVRPVLDEERLDVFTGGDDLQIVMVKVVRVVHGDVHGDQEPWRYRSIDGVQLLYQPVILGAAWVHVGVCRDDDDVRRSILEGVVRVAPFVGHGVRRRIHVQSSIWAFKNTKLCWFDTRHAPPMFVPTEDLSSVRLLFDICCPIAF
mmetsp:Transcript_20213/g.56334  ORF Transcript_20213/g.56334 Transcript_20213/m.56334 type:complete len:231 (-) Transcript_20213:327-1019(-)